MWAEDFDEKRAEMFAIEDRISLRVADALMMRLTPGEKELLAKRYTGDADAYQLYLQGRYYQQQGLEGRADGRRIAVQFYEKAVDKDPTYALAWAGLSLGHAGLAVYNQASPQLTWPKAETAAIKALELDDELSEAHTASGAVKEFWQTDFAGAEREFQRALELNPRNIFALRYYENLLSCTKRFDESIALRERVVDLAPLSPVFQAELASGYFVAGRDDRGIQLALLVLGMDPNQLLAHNELAKAYARRHDYEKAIAHARRAAALSGGQRSPVLGYVLGMAGRRAEAEKILQDLESRSDKEGFSPLNIAIVYLGLGDREAALRELERVENTHSVGTLRLGVEPIFDPIRSDPRFSALLKRVGLPSH